MQIPMTLSAKAASSVEALRQLERPHLKHVFRSLDAPPLQELHGEYDAELLDQGGRLPEIIIRTLFNRSGKWSGKAFSPSTGHEGWGYNVFQRNQRVVQKFPMRTYIGQGRCGSRHSLFLDYRPFNGGVMRSMIDEVRRVAHGVYLGIGVVGPSFLRCREIPFLLLGPQREFSPDPAMAAHLFGETSSVENRLLRSPRSHQATAAQVSG